ncbi:MAG: hypothetical protein ACPKPY_08790 [Nitrososphaeraceae archaeon]
MRHSNKITSICVMALLSIMAYSLTDLSDMNFQDRMAYAGIVSDSEIILDNQSTQKFTLQKYTKEHFNIAVDTTVPKTIEPGTQGTVSGFTTNAIHQGIVHLYYNYGKNYTAEFSSYFNPDDFADKCTDKTGSSDISISCSHSTHSIKFTIKDTTS